MQQQLIAESQVLSVFKQDDVPQSQSSADPSREHAEEKCTSLPFIDTNKTHYHIIKARFSP